MLASPWQRVVSPYCLQYNAAIGIGKAVVAVSLRQAFKNTSLVTSFHSRLQRDPGGRTNFEYSRAPAKDTKTPTMGKPKEDRSGWVAVQPEFSQGASGQEPPPIKPPTSSYNFFQKENSSKIRSDLAASGQSTDLGSLGRAISDRWKFLTPDQRAVYDDMARDDMMRFNRESHLRDVEVMKRLEAQNKARENLILETEDGLRTTRKGLRKEKRKKEKAERKKEKKAERKKSKAAAAAAAGGAAAAAAHDGVESDDDDDEESSSSDSSYDSDDPDGAKKKRAARRPQQLSEAAQRRRDEARAEKAAKERYIEERQEELRQDRAAQAKRRLDFLLKQSDIFSHFGNVKEDTTKLGMNKNQQQKVDTEAKGDDGVVISHRDRRREGGDAGITEEAELEEGDEHEATFLTTQPSTLGFGTMRPYQLEGLNWMIRLQENGVNGILADEMG